MSVMSVRLIPAHAGKTDVCFSVSVSVQAHPRSRGENLEDHWEVLEADGSSPLTRGKRASRQTTSEVTGLIPAHAGKTTPRWSNLSSRSAHPRSRGENRGRWRQHVGVDGSSPLTRGKLLLLLVGCLPMRLIPAHAGKTDGGFAWKAGFPAHPRSRGENETFTDAATAQRGSSPLTRGKLSSARPENLERRLIPAHAGKTGVGLLSGDLAAAHPRSRGENLTSTSLGAFSAGSSPLTRGKRALRRPYSRRERLIPAHAGNTQARPSPPG